MNRREIICHSAWFGAAAALGLALPVRSWAVLAAPLGWSKNDEDLLNLIGDTILPATPGSPGAGAVGVGRFILTMVNECQPPETAEGLREALREFYREVSSRSFESLTASERESQLRQFEGRSATEGARRGTNPFRLIKELTLLGYFTSEIGATQALRFDPVPGVYRGSLRLNDGDRSWAT